MPAYEESQGQLLLDHLQHRAHGDHRENLISVRSVLIVMAASAATAPPAVLQDGLAAAALPGICLHRAFLLGDPPTTELIAKVVDQIILPAVTRG